MIIKSQRQQQGCAQRANLDYIASTALLGAKTRTHSCCWKYKQLGNGSKLDRIIREAVTATMSRLHIRPSQ